MRFVCRTLLSSTESVKNKMFVRDPFKNFSSFITSKVSMDLCTIQTRHKTLTYKLAGNANATPNFIFCDAIPCFSRGCVTPKMTLSFNIQVCWTPISFYATHSYFQQSDPELLRFIPGCVLYTKMSLAFNTYKLTRTSFFCATPSYFPFRYQILIICVLFVGACYVTHL